MKVRLDIQSIAVKQLESAIWMYAYNYDEVAVHTVAGAAFELYSKRLKLSTFKEDSEKYIKAEKVDDFYSLWNRPYNFFKHGEHKNKPLEYIEYDEKAVEVPLYLAAEGNLLGPEEFKLNCANVYRFYFYITHPDLFDESFYQEHFLKHVLESGLTMEIISQKSSLRAWLDAIGHTFINGTGSPFRDVAKAKL